MAANFKKKSVPLSSRGQAVPRGSKLSISNNQLLVSSGVPSLDNIIGGGIPVGSVLLIEEDAHAIFSNLLLRYFMAEGVICRHGLSLISANDSTADEVLKKLPLPVDHETAKSKPTAASELPEKKNNDEELKIAWRYQNLSTQEVHTSTVKFGHYYDLTKTMGEEHFAGLHIAKLIAANYTETHFTHKNDKINTVCKSIITDIQNLIKNHNYSSTGSQPDKRILRLALNSFGSPLWPTFTNKDEAMMSLSWFLLALRSVLRNAFAVCIVTIPVHLFEEPSISRRLEQCVDNAVHLESFGGSVNEKNPAFTDYDGLIHIKKKGRINCLAGHDIDTSDWAFKLKRKKFSIEKLHLPPELSETASRAQLETKKVTIQSGERLCSSSQRTVNKSLEF